MLMLHVGALTSVHTIPPMRHVGLKASPVWPKPWTGRTAKLALSNQAMKEKRGNGSREKVALSIMLIKTFNNSLSPCYP